MDIIPGGKFEFAKVLNKHIDKFYVLIYSGDGRLVLKIFMKAIKSWEPKKGQSSYDIEKRSKTFRYLLTTKFGSMQFCVMDKNIMISSWDDPPLLDKIVETLFVDTNFELVEPREEKEVGATQEVPPKPCGFRFAADGSRGLIYIDLDEPFQQDTLLKAVAEIPGIKITKRKNVFSSWGPLEASDEITTSMGIITISSNWEGMDVGYTISAESGLMTRIVSQMKNSNFFFEIK